MPKSLGSSCSLRRSPWTNRAILLLYGPMKTKQTSTITVGFVPLGCPKNVVDSEKMLADIAQAGMLICADPDAADVIIINTCGFIEPAKAESIEAIERAVQRKKTGPTRKVIVAGCLSERMGEQLTQVDQVTCFGKNPDSYPLYLF